MSLIPSESYTFPDHFTTTIVPSRKLKKDQAVESRREKPAIVPLPDPEPTVRHQKLETAPSPRPNPALLRATAPPPRIPDSTIAKQHPAPILKPRAVAATRAPAMDPAPMRNLAPAVQNVIQMPSPRVVHQPTQIVQHTAPPAPRPRPAAVVATSQADFFELFAQTGDGTLAKRRRKMKFRRFLACESVALAILLPLAIIGLSHRPSNAVLLWIMNFSTIASAIAAALIPIFFYAVTPTLPEIER